MRIPLLLSLAGLAVAAAAPSAAASDPAIVPVPVLNEGDAVPGIGAVTSISNLAVNETGNFLAEVDTNDPNTDTDGAIVQNGPGIVIFREGDPVVVPAGATLDSFDAVTLNDVGNGSFNFFLDNTPGGLSDDSGVYLNNVLILPEGFVSQSPAFTSGTPYIGFFETKINDLNQVLVMASVDDPGIASSVDRALVILDPLAGEQVLFKEGDPAPGTSETITDFGTGPHEFDFSNTGSVLFGVDLTGLSATNAAIYRDSTLLAREGDPSPIAGRNWATLTSSEVSLSSNGEHWALSASLDGDSASNLVIVVDGQKLVQEGDSLPDIAPFTLTGFGSGPIHVTDAGDVIWYGDWNDPNTAIDNGIFFNHRLILQEGVTLTNAGQLVTGIAGISDGYAASDDGRHLVVDSELNDAFDAVIHLDRGPWQILGGAFPGASGTPKLRASGAFTAGTPISLEVTNGLPNAVGLLVVGLSTLNVPFLGATLVPAPDVVLALPLNANGGLFLTATSPAGPSGVNVWLQFLIDDPTAVLGLAATNAVVGTIP